MNKSVPTRCLLFVLVAALILNAGCVPFHALKSGEKRSNTALPPADSCQSVTVDMSTSHRAYSWKLTMSDKNDRARYEKFLSRADKVSFVYFRRIGPSEAFPALENCVIRIRQKDGAETALFIVTRNLLIGSDRRAFKTNDDLFECVFAMAPKADSRTMGL
jgi:hypothetical protein